MVVQQNLDLLIKVRVLVPQPRRAVHPPTHERSAACPYKGFETMGKFFLFFSILLSSFLTVAVPAHAYGYSNYHQERMFSHRSILLSQQSPTSQGLTEKDWIIILISTITGGILGIVVTTK